ncbi:unnamed protein product [Aphanomyces euteiches]
MLGRSSTSGLRHILRVQLHKASDLAAGDFSLLGRHSSDPYVFFTVGNEKYKSTVVPKNINPTWEDATFDFHVTDGDLFTKVLDVQVFDQDNHDDDLLGSVAIPLAQFASQLPDQVRAKPYHLNVPAQFTKQKRNSQIFLTINLIEGGGGNDNPLAYIPRHLKVHLHKATDLAAADFALLGKGKSDPYVVFSIGSQRFKSETINKCLDPVWKDNPIFDFDLTQDDLFTQVLDIQVFDSDHGLSADDLIGTLSIPLAQFDNPTGDLRPRAYPLTVPDTYRRQNVHSQLYLTIEMDEKPDFIPPPPPTDETAEMIAQMQAEIAALKMSSQSIVHKMEAEIKPTPATPSSPSSTPTSQPDPESEGDLKKRALVNELHGLLHLPPIKTFTKLTHDPATTDGATLHWKNEVENLKAQLDQEKRLNDMLKSQSSDQSSQDEVERLKHEVAMHKATLAATQTMMEEQLRREAQTQEELKLLKTIAVRQIKPTPTSPPSPPPKAAAAEAGNDDEDESLWL